MIVNLTDVRRYVLAAFTLKQQYLMSHSKNKANLQQTGLTCEWAFDHDWIGGDFNARKYFHDQSMVGNGFTQLVTQGEVGLRVAWEQMCWRIGFNWHQPSCWLEKLNKTIARGSIDRWKTTSIRSDAAAPPRRHHDVTLKAPMTSLKHISRQTENCEFTSCVKNTQTVWKESLKRRKTAETLPS